MTDLDITAPLDQQLPVDFDDILEMIDELFVVSVDTKNVDLVYDFCSHRVKQLKLSGISLAKALWMLHENWGVYEIGDEFLDAVTFRLGLHRHTIERYIRVWDMLKSAPKELVDDLQQQGIKSLIPIAHAIAQGYEIDGDTWNKLADAPDYSTVSHIINEDVKGKEGRSNRLTIYIDRDGSMWAVSGEARLFVGSLELSDENEMVQKAIKRIIDNAGMIQR